ncbi:MAG: glycosyltransferase [Pseudanabaena sp. ELA607]
MKILLTADPELPVPPLLYGGVQRLVGTLVDLLRQKGYTVGLVAHADSTAKVDYWRAFPVSQSQGKLAVLQNSLALVRAVQEFKPDVVHSFSRLMYMLPFMAWSMPKIMCYGRMPTPKTVSLAAKLAGNSLIFGACSQHIGAAGRLAGGDWRIIYNFVELDKYTFVTEVADDAPLVFLSRIEPIKGAHNAIAIAKACGRRLLIAGNYSTKGMEGDYWENQIKPQLGKDGIEYVGTVNDEQKNTLLGAAAAMVVPIEWEEPFGIVFAESLACGTPVISCRRGAVPEIVRDGIDGFVLDPAADIVKQGQQAVQRLGEIQRSDCRQRVENNFAAEIILAQYIALYEAMVCD